MQEKKPFYTLLFGAVISAILAGSCCLAPLLFLLFGVSMSSLSFLQIFAPYQPYFIALASLVILYLWVDYFRQKSAAVCSGSLCKHYLLYLTIGTLMVLVLISYPYWIDAIMIEGE